ncbi:hypothetical protein GCM10027055_20620 [Janibacter alkaliphilus]|uniref:DUF3618 domain-containing protein n=1 Tax=Janibacter alkaliphilus TaxID=1069963 RepID=A0A852XAR5_9MICO|nr:DUF3618 domain-containing protein [Janibacter alkaliphilus]NYG38630.1 hypothetical protein [Janibacter alkaliphilus]
MSEKAPSELKLENDITEARDRLATTIDELTVRAAPKNVVARQTEAAKKGFYDATHDDKGELRTDIFVAAGAAVAGVVLLVVLNSRRRERKWARQRARRSW